MKRKRAKKIKLPRVYHIDKEEIAAVTKVLKRGPLSGFVGVAGKPFLGGPEVQLLERAFEKKFGVKYAVSFNSATTALHGAIAALGIGPGDEVILPPYTMSASATAILMNGAVPVFVDIDERTFCIDAHDVERKVTKRTKAVMAVNLFGGVPDFAALLRVCKKYKLALIEDNAQAPGARWRGRYAGTIGDIGVFSFNVHKTMQAGEGGVLVTNNRRFALRAQLSRNHGESVIPGLSRYTDGPIFGSNYRMTEVTAAIARVQLSRLDFLNRKRIALANHLTERLPGIKGLTLPYVAKDTSHVYYTYPMKIDEKALGITRAALVRGLCERGFPVGKGYVEPLYLLPLFQEQKAFNNTHFPFDYAGVQYNYRKGLCPVTERMYETELFGTDMCQHPYTTAHVDAFADAVLDIVGKKRK